jgi:hypothetical protein
LPDEDRKFDILKSTTCVFLKLPMLIIDYYGWDGMKKLFEKAAKDNSAGLKLKSDEERTAYMIENISLLYGIDFCNIFEYWRFNISDSTREALKNLPKEALIMDIYKNKKEFDKYTKYS